ncbi:MAG: TolC family protein [Bacteroidetes bacterium]|nr:TolC family protein [Bacteroidota bacterium]
MINKTPLLLLLLWAIPSLAQQGADASLTLPQCYDLAEKTYPLTKQRELITKTREYTVDNIAKGIYPQLSVNGSATYQSDVTKVPLPAGLGISVPTVSKDQYKLYGEATQTLTDFGINKQRRTISQTDADLQEANLTTQLYQLKDRINQLFFGILLIDGQLRQNELAATDIQTGINTVDASIHNGTGYLSSANKLKAELLKTHQQAVELKASRKAFIDMLGLFLNLSLTENTQLQKPQPPSLSDSVNRPELKAYDLQVKAYNEQMRLTKLNLNPQLNAFFQGGLGKPNPVNFLSTQISGYYLTGIRLTWNIGNFYTYKKDRLINKNNQEMVQAQKSTFLFNTNLTLHQQNADITKYQQLIQNDNEIVDLRESVSKTSAVQLQNGVITANDYLLDVNAASQARQDRIVHEIQLLQSQYNHQTTSGN